MRQNKTDDGDGDDVGDGVDDGDDGDDGDGDGNGDDDDGAGDGDGGDGDLLLPAVQHLVTEPTQIICTDDDDDHYLLFVKRSDVSWISHRVLKGSSPLAFG